MDCSLQTAVRDLLRDMFFGTQCDMLRTKRLSFADAAVSVANQNEVGRDPADAQHASCICVDLIG